MREIMRKVRQFLMVCSGAVEETLQKEDCKADAKKYVMIGAFVLLTAIFAFFSSTFAFYTGTGSVALAVMLGIAWALMIFTLDRFVVSGIRKSDVNALPPRQRALRRTVEWLIALPRILLAALISVVVATPLELRFFQGEINAQIAKNHSLARQAAGGDVDREFPKIGELRQQDRELADQTAAAWKDWQRAEHLASQELAGQALTSLKGDGPVYKRLKAEAEDLRRLAAVTESKNAATIAANTQRIGAFELELQKRLADAQGAVDQSDGFLARYAALGQLAGSSPDVRRARTFMTLVFLVIELTPVIMKLLLRRGPYDDLMDTLEHQVSVAELLKRSHMNDDAHMEVARHSRRNAEIPLLEEALSQDVYDPAKVKTLAPDELDEAQTKLARAAVQMWYRKQMTTFGSRPPVPTRKPPKANASASPSTPATDREPASVP
jgi:hypothetical protein